MPLSLLSLDDELRIPIYSRPPRAKPSCNLHAIGNASYSAMLSDHGLTNVVIEAMTLFRGDTSTTPTPLRCFQKDLFQVLHRRGGTGLDPRTQFGLLSSWRKQSGPPFTSFLFGEETLVRSSLRGICRRSVVNCLT